MIRLRLAGKTRNQVPCQRTARKILSQKLRRMEEESRVVFSVHRLQRPVTAALQREMKMAAELSGLGKPPAEVLRDHRRLQRAETQPHFTRLRRHSFDHISQRRLSFQIQSIGRHLNTGEHQLAEALFPQFSGLRDRVGDRHAAQTAADIGDDAIGAKVPTPVLNLQHGAGSARNSPRREQFDGFSGKRAVNLSDSLAGGYSALHCLDESHSVSRSENHAGSDFGVFLRAQLGIATADRDHRVGVFIVQTTNHLARFSAALRCDCAGIDDDGIRLLSRCSGHMPVPQQPLFHRLCLKLIDLAAQCRDQVLHFCTVSWAGFSRELSFSFSSFSRASSSLLTLAFFTTCRVAGSI